MKKIGFLIIALLAMLALLAAGCGGSQEAPRKAETEKVLRLVPNRLLHHLSFKKKARMNLLALIWILFVLWHEAWL